MGGDPQLGSAPPRGTHQLAVPHCGTARRRGGSRHVGRLFAAAIRRGRPRQVNDMWIAACCLTHGIPLATLNLKDYEDFNQHHGLRILGRE